MVEPLYSSRVLPASFLAAANVGLFYKLKGDLIVPDVLLSLGAIAAQLILASFRRFLLFQRFSGSDSNNSLKVAYELALIGKPNRLSNRCNVPFTFVQQLAPLDSLPQNILMWSCAQRLPEQPRKVILT